jgi:hypothetical protein
MFGYVHSNLLLLSIKDRVSNTGPSIVYILQIGYLGVENNILLS